MIRNLIRCLVSGRTEKTESDIIADMFKTHDIMEMVNALNSGFIKMKAVSSHDYRSASGKIKVCMDIYGPEITISGGHGLLDCRPQNYGLSYIDGNRLADAITASCNGRNSVDVAEEAAYIHQERLDLYAKHDKSGYILF